MKNYFFFIAQYDIIFIYNNKNMAIIFHFGVEIMAETKKMELSKNVTLSFLGNETINEVKLYKYEAKIKNVEKMTKMLFLLFQMVIVMITKMKQILQIVIKAILKLKKLQMPEVAQKVMANMGEKLIVMIQLSYSKMLPKMLENLMEVI